MTESEKFLLCGREAGADALGITVGMLRETLHDGRPEVLLAALDTLEEKLRVIQQCHAKAREALLREEAAQNALPEQTIS